MSSFIYLLGALAQVCAAAMSLLGHDFKAPRLVRCAHAVSAAGIAASVAADVYARHFG